ncbi:MAG: hypothetical protein QXX64_06215 [Nitrososphaera sp.]|uniref:Uncharacterized protein n=1 Tax=Nitrososphaera gargensis (strain Ga9.2) TaxID=1237085 RepID=K0IH83_NITGG|nr:hypothetical protein [Candidatus Nitrososphaera gargensis]AFU59255.1 hypothetical protein Ngar_c23290 [Candidatus Nitrososphaera gargensis Ga9.2]
MRRGVWGLILSALAFSVSYAFVEYYIIRDTTFGYNPVLFSLLYPYHFAMAAVFVIAAYGLLCAHVSVKGIVPSLVIAGALFSSMLAIEDFVWFVLRAAAPVHGDANAGKLVVAGEWTTQFMGSVDAHFTAIPNWYFLSIGFSAAALGTTRRRQRQQLTAAASDHLLTT